MRLSLLAATLVVAWPALRAQELPRAAPIDIAAVASFADGFFPEEMARRHIPGAVFVFVSGGKLAIARGFGAAQLEPWRAVDPDRTGFRLASVSKVVTATAALQLVEQGRLDLTRDVNAYLENVHIPAFAGTSVTLHDLLTHTAGFDERLIGVAARHATDLLPLDTYLAQSMPPRFIEPGRVVSYSNHGLSLVGLLVEQASGRSFERYVREDMLEPLGMHRSGFLTGTAPADLAVAYEFAGGRHQALSPEYLQLGPAGAFFTTGTDMARFLIAHLRGGAYENQRILREETMMRMHARQFAQHPRLSGWAYGIWEDVRQGPRALLHNGGGKGYRALLYLLPAQDVGFFVAYNLADRHEDGELQEVFIERFRRVFVPSGDTAIEPASHTSVANLVGEYRYVRRARTTIEKLIAVVNNVRIDEQETGVLTIARSSGKPVRLTAIGPHLFRQNDDRGLVAFDVLKAGRPERLVLDVGFPMVYDRVPFFATLRVQAASLFSMSVAFLYAAAWRPGAALIRRTGKARWDALKWSTWLGGVASALNLLFVIGFPLAFLGRMEGGVPQFIYGTPAVANLLLVIPPFTGILAVTCSVAVFRMWRNGLARPFQRCLHSLVAIALVAFTGFAAYWRLMGPDY